MKNSNGHFKKGKVSQKRGITLTDKGQICACCKVDKELSEFGKMKQRFNGLHVYCKSCCREKRKGKEAEQKQYNEDYYFENKTKILKANKQRHADNKEKYVKTQREYYKNNKEKIRQVNKEWANNHIEETNKIKARWKKQNPLAVRHHGALRRLRLKNQVSKDVDLEAIKLFYKNTPKGMEVDHIIPVSKGGLHCVSNFQYLSPKENRQKYNTLIDYSVA